MSDNLRQNPLLNPFSRIAGYKALVWGTGAILISTALCYIGKCHFHGLLHVGSAPNSAWWSFVAEHLIIWLIPAILIYLPSLFLSRSHVRLIDVLGTIAFAQIPLAILSAIMLVPAMQKVNSITHVTELQTLMSNSYFMNALALAGIGSLLILTWTLVWMFKATSVSCNLKGLRLWSVYLIGIFGGEILVRYLINLCY